MREHQTTTKIISSSKGVPLLKKVFYNSDNKEEWWLSDGYTLSSDQGIITISKVTETTARLSITLKIRESFDGAIDKEPKNGILDGNDSFGGWGSILIRDTNTLYDFKGDNDTGIYLEITEGNKDDPITKGGPYYNISKLIQKANTAFPQFGIIELKRESFSHKKGEYNIFPFFAFLNSESLFGQKQQTWHTEIALNELNADTQYYARVVLRGVDVSEWTRTEFVSFKTSPAGSNNDPTLQVLEEGTGEATGSEGGSKNNDNIYGQEVTCSFGVLPGQKTDILGCFVQFYYDVILHFFSWLLRASAGMMDVFMAYSLSSYMYKNGFIVSGWTIVRDVCNIFFIFILLWTAFKMVVNDSHYKAQETIVNIVIIGLLINFSLFFSKVIIDMGNISARVFYNQIRVSYKGAPQDDVINSVDGEKLGIQPVSISEAIANGLEFGKFEDTAFEKLQGNQGGLGYGSITLLITLNIIVYIAAAWIFIKTSFAFLGRILTLWVGMIMSPFAFTSKIIDGGHGHGPLDIDKIGWSSWIKNMFEASFYPAVFLFFIYLITLLLQQNFIGDIVKSSDDLAATPYMITVMLKIAFILALLKLAGDYAQKMSGTFGGAITDMAQKGVAFLGGAAVGAVTGGAAWALQRSGGAAKAMDALSDEKVGGNLKKASTGDKDAMMALYNLDSKKYSQFGKITKDSSGKDVEMARKKAQREVESLQKRSTTSWDLRNTKAMQGLSSATGLNFNAGMPKVLSSATTNGGLQAVVDRRAVKDAAYFKSIGASEDEIKRAKSGVEDAKKALEDAEDVAKKKITGAEEENSRLVQKKQAGFTLSAIEEAQFTANQQTIKDAKKLLKDAHDAAKDETNKLTPVDPANPTDAEKIALAKRAHIDAEKNLKESSKSGLRRYQQYLKDNHYDHGTARDGNPLWGVFGARRLIRGDIRGAMTDFRRDLTTAMTGAVTGAASGAIAGSMIPIIGTAIGAGVGLVGGGVLSSLNKHLFRLDQKVVSLADHAVAADHIHEPHLKEKYKPPGGAWLDKVFSGKGFAGLNTGGGHDDHGHGGGHDDHGGGHH